MNKEIKNWFSSDYHLDHKNILKYDNRPFENIEDMNEEIIKNHNSLVTNDDNFYFLGDFSFNNYRTEEFLKRLNGNKFFIKGNHDKRETIALYKKYGFFLGGHAEIRIENIDITLCHYAMRVWNKSHHGAFHLYGHSHGSLPDDPNSLSFDIGCNIWNYKPLEFKEIKRLMSLKTYKPIDHHR